MESTNPIQDISGYKKKIICYRADQSACWFYRIHLPMSFLSKKHKEYFISVVGYMEPSQVGKYDLAILQRQYREEVLVNILKMKNAGTKLVYEVDDDLFDVPDWNPAHSTYNSHTNGFIKKFLNSVDAVFVTNEYLKSVYEQYNNNVYVLPNSLAFDAFNASPRNSKKPVVLWQGSMTHKKDLGLIKDAVNQLVKDDDSFIKMWPFEMKGTYTVPGVDFKGFNVVLSQVDADIGLAPLVPHKFNKSKSNLKFLEYAAQGIATVASNFGPYAESIVHEESGLLVNDVKGWYESIRRLIDDVPLREKLVANAQAYAKENFDLDKNYILWKNAIDEVIES